MNVEIGAEAALFPEKEYISGIFVTLRPIVILHKQNSNKECKLMQCMKECHTAKQLIF